MVYAILGQRASLEVRCVWSLWRPVWKGVVQQAQPPERLAKPSEFCTHGLRVVELFHLAGRHGCDECEGQPRDVPPQGIALQTAIAPNQCRNPKMHAL